MRTIQKVLNSSVVLVRDEGGQESILLGKGIGYGRKAGQILEPQAGERIFLPAQPETKQLMELLESIPASYLEMAEEIVEYAQAALNTRLNRHIYLALTDHLHFAVERFQRGILVTNRVYWELKNFYPREYQVGQYGLEVVERYAQVKLPEEEAANIAFHIVNAQQEEASQYDAMRAAKLIRSIVSLVTYTLHIQADPNSLHYARFLSHLQYFTQRFYADKMLSDPTDFLYRQLYEAYPQIVECAERVRTYILREYGKAIPNEEVAYLAVHIQRLAARDA